MDDDRTLLDIRKGSTGRDEGEYLLPMCDTVVVADERKFKKGRLLVMKVSNQKDPSIILKKRINELKDKIIQYGGEEKYNQLIEIIDEIGECGNIKEKSE